MWRPLLLIGCFWLGLQAPAAAEVRHKEVVLYQSEGRVLLDLVEEYQLNETLTEALENGVPLVFETEARVVRERSIIWNAGISEKQLRRRLRYHPLAGLYRVEDVVPAGESRSFATLEAALAWLGENRGIELTRVEELDPERNYVVQVETSLVISALPLPLQTLAHLSPDWHFGSKVWEWRFRP